MTTTFTVTQELTLVEYKQLRRYITELYEGLTQTVYLDSVGLPSIGIGWNLAATGHTEMFLNAIGVVEDDELIEYKEGHSYQTLLQNLETIIFDDYGSGGSLETLTQEESDLLDDLDAAMTNALVNPIEFSFASDEDARLFFDLHVETYEKELDRILDNWDVISENNTADEIYDFPPSKERIALLTLIYGGYGFFQKTVDGNLVVTNTTQALLDDNRARVWFEIRYGSNGGASVGAGIAKRRYVESAFFSPFSNPDNITQEEAGDFISFLNSVYNEDTNQTFLQNIIAYENLYWRNAGNAITDYHLNTNDPYSIKEKLFFQDILKPIASYLIDYYLQDKNTGLNGSDYDFLGDVVLGFTGGATYTVIDAKLNDGITTATDQSDLLIATNNDVANTLSGGLGDDFLIGSTNNDTLIGGEGKDVLFGNEGADTLTGGAGNDTYFVDDAGDQVVENTDEGVDFIKSEITYTLNNNLEDLELTGEEAINGTGNELDNTISGNSAANTLIGGGGADRLHGTAGDDVLDGGEGNDELFGGKDFDTYLGNNGDKITDSDGKGSVKFDTTVLTGGTEGEQKGVYEGNGYKYTLMGGNSVRVTGADGSMVVSSAVGDFRVTEVWQQTYFNGIPSGPLVYIETKGDESKVPLGIALKSTEIRKVFLWATAGGGDPIALDLNGDGIHTTTLNLNSPTFDYDGDGLAEISGWLSPQDGFLAVDTNNNGIIDSGRELFGNYTLLKDGSFSQHGFQVLAEYDSNFDGKIDVQDTDFSKLKIWRDLNENGRTDTGELKSLHDSNVQSVSLTAQLSQESQNGNAFFVQGEFTRTDGSIGSAVDIIFATTPHLGEVVSIDTESLMHLPNIVGSGAVPSLYVAMGSIDGAPLKNLVESFVVETNDAKRMTLADEILMTWSGANKTGDRQRAVTTLLAGNEFTLDWETGFVLLREQIYSSLTLSADFKDWYGLLDVKLQNDFLVADVSRWLSATELERTSSPQEFSSKTKHFIRALMGSSGWESQAFASSLMQLVETFSPEIAKDIFDYVKFYSKTAEIGGDNLNGSFIEGTVGNDVITLDAGTNTVVFNKYSGNDRLIDWSPNLDSLHVTGQVEVQQIDGQNVILNLVGEDDSIIIESFRNLEGNVKIVFDDGSEWSWAEALWRSTVTSNLTRSQIIYGTSSNDTLLATGIDGAIFGGQGDDILIGSNAKNTLVGDSGNDLLIAGAGDDVLDGGLGQDTYQFSSNTGRDVIRAISRDIEGGDIIEIDIQNPEQVKVGREGNDIVLLLNGNGSRIRLENWYANPESSFSEIRFANGTVWNSVDIFSRVAFYFENNGLNNFASDQDDRIFGSVGDDNIYGENGSDIIDGGAGNDKIYTTDGNDVIIFGYGSGSDTIYVTSNGELIETEIRFSSNVTPDDLTLSRTGTWENDLVVRLQGSDDQLVLRSWLDSIHENIFRFSDDTIWNNSDIFAHMVFVGTSTDDILFGDNQNQTLSGLAGDDVIYAFAGNDIVQGGQGNDSLYGDEGNDTLVGNSGNDFLAGGYGNDTFRFGRGYGQDYITDFNLYSDTDRILLNSDVFQNDLQLTRSGDQGHDLLIRINGTSDQLLIESGFISNEQGIQIEFADGSVWTQADVLNRIVVASTSDNDLLFGSTTADEIAALAGDDFIHGYEGDDILDGGSGNDIIDSGSGNDDITGGAGDDFIMGLQGDDIYRFSRGDGNDLIHSDTDGIDTLYFDSTIMPADVNLLRNPIHYSNSLIITFNNSTDSITLLSWFNLAAPSFQKIVFSDGTTWNFQDILQRVFITTSASDDVINATQLNDVIDGLAGNDTLYGFFGNDSLSGGSGDDFIDGGEGNDSLIGGTGNDTLWGDYDDDVLDGGAGNDELSGGAGSNTYLLNRGSGQDVINDYSDEAIKLKLGANILPTDIAITRGLEGSNEYLVVSIKNSTDNVVFRNGIYSLDQGMVSIEFDNGFTWTSAEIIDQIIFPVTTGDDFVAGTNKNENINALGGADMIFGYGGNDTLNGNAGADYLDGGDGDDILIGGSGNDYLSGGLGVDRIDSGAGNDQLNGGDENDIYVFGFNYGEDIITSYGWRESLKTIELTPGVSESDVIFRRSSQYYENLEIQLRGTNDVLIVNNFFSEGQNDQLQIIFDTGTVWSDSYIKENIDFIGTNYSDEIIGLSTANTLVGFTGNDILRGMEGNDFINGGKGDDYLEGGLGSDTYYFERGDGKDQIVEGNSADVSVDQIQFGDGITSTDLEVIRDINSLVIKITNTSDQITVDNWFNDSTQQVEQLKFSDGTVWTQVEILNATQFFESSGSVYGTKLNDTITGQEYTDSIYGMEGNDIIYGNGGQDLLHGDAGSDQLFGGDDSDYLFGGDGNDLMDGGMGSDFLQVGFGNDTVVFRQGSGNDTVHITSLSSILNIKLDNLLSAEVEIFRNENDLNIKLLNSDDLLIVPRWFNFRGATNDLASPSTAFELPTIQIHFADGTILDSEGIWASISRPSAHDNFIVGSDNDDVLVGLAGNDILLGDKGQDVLDGGTGNDTLNGGEGNDIYLFSEGFGLDTINNYDELLGNHDVIRFSADISPLDVLLYRDDSHLYFQINDDVITVTNWVSEQPYSAIESVEFADGTIWNSTQFLNARYRGSQDDDQLNGTVTNDYLEGLSGNDSLYGDEGNDILDGGSGNDVLQGGLGNDTYLFSRNAGQDNIYESDLTVGNTDVIRFADDIVPADVLTYRDEANLYLSIGSDVITISDWFADPGARIERVEFFDGTVWTPNQLSLARFRGTTGDDYLYGSTGNDYFEGVGGNDTIYGNEGNDTLDGGSGNDTLDGGSGNDIYLISRGAGQDTINETAGTDSIQFASDIATTDVIVWRDTSNLYAGINGTTDVVTVAGWFDVSSSRVENLQFADGTIWNSTILQSAKLRGTEGADGIYGTTGNDYIEGLGGSDYLSGDLGNDTLDGGTGNDVLYGDGGNDIYLIARGSGQDAIYETSGTDSIQFASDILPADVEVWRDTSNLYVGIAGTADVVTVSSWFDDTTYRVENIKFVDGTIWNSSVMSTAKFKGTAGNDSISGTTSSDQIFGMGGNDNLYGDNGNDTLDGGTGNDNLSGDAGNDIYLFGSGDGQDIVIEISGSTDILRFKSGVTQSDICVSRDNTHLYFSIISTGDKITIQNHFGGDTNARIERVEFNDGSSWDLTAINAKMSTTSTGDDFFWGTTGNDVVNGLDGNDQLIGNAGNDTLTGGAGNDLLDGGLGNDSMSGGSGDDIYIVDSASDVVTENADEGTDLVNSAITYVLGANLENLTLTGSAVINATGNTLNNILIGNDQVNLLVGDLGDDTLIGGAGNDNLNGGAGADNLLGGLGNDTYVIDSEDVVTEFASEGTDTIQAGFNYTLGDNLENLTLTGSATDGTGNTLNNSLVGNSAANLLIGLAGNDNLNGGTGADTLIGGIGNDTYTVDNIGDVVTEFANEGTDTVNSSIAYVLADTLENLTLSGSAAINGTGNAFNNVITGNSGANTLNGGDGNDSLNGGTGVDTLIGGLGNDTYTVDNTGDIVTENTDEGIDTISSSITYTLGNSLENLTLTGTTAINGTGNSLDNILIGNTVVNILTGGAGNDTLDGGTGADSLVGGSGNDTYIVDNASDVITEAANEGIDIVNSSVTFTLAANVENLTLTGNSAINSTGNTLANTLIGNSSINILNGGIGADTLIGAAGDDTYVVDDAGDLVIESVAQGTDLVQSSISYSLTDNVENLTLTGTAANNASGNTLNNTLTGNSGSNILNAGEGADTMIGAAGNDTYIVDNIGDVITEGSSGGTDIVQSNVTYTLASNVENITLTGISAINATGNTLVNTLTGNEAANILDGGTGADTMLGGNGDDIYVVDNVGDVVTENINEGIDLVQSKITFTLGDNFENLTLTGSTAINGTGNSSDNVLTGNSAVNTLTGGNGNDVLNGAGGADILIGGAGNDVYVVDNVNDQITETTNEGVDAVNASVTHTLAANVENLTLTGTGNISGAGNALDNILIGTTGNNTLTANDGNDRLDGGAGNDTLNGGLNNDTYIFGRGYAVDTIVENDSSTTDQDVVQFGSDIATDQLWFRHVGNNLEATIVGTNDKLVISNWYLGDAYRVEQFVTADGSILLDTQVEALVSAMAGFAPPVGVGSIISQEARDQLQPVLAASWN